ncbi:hypothetical protein PG911_07110 [Tenacibaculum ovolyticum]|uniref:hypothetical protein n=1 Tax=Tenacibaculum ovolyticum TaxID=104270 RepID=UPI0022F3A813|nr:hypothetical protein [Tenacibaculum ovolyticum]WBX78017.1 hypothetical protein PG911_07110 [Tenacibaculum ovolyticum]
MIEKLIIDLFTKIKQEESITSRNGKAVFFVKEILETKHDAFNRTSVQTITRLHKKYIDRQEDVIVGVPEPFIKDIMAQYLNFENFEEYKASFQYPDREITSSSLETEKNPVFENAKTTIDTATPIKWYKKNANKLVVTASTAFMLVLSIYTYQNNYSIKGNCIIWKTDHFEKSSCLVKNAIDNNDYSINIERFKKILVTPDTTFFIKGKAIIWYGENKKKVKEYFTDRGFHPETLKRLNPVTRPILHREKLLNE